MSTLARHIILSAHHFWATFMLLFNMFHLLQLIGPGKPHDLSWPFRTFLWKFWTGVLDKTVILSWREVKLQAFKIGECQQPCFCYVEKPIGREKNKRYKERTEMGMGEKAFNCVCNL